MSERVAIIGMGQMGAGMAALLTEKGLDVLGYDIDPKRRQALAEQVEHRVEHLLLPRAHRLARGLRRDIGRVVHADAPQNQVPYGTLRRAIGVRQRRRNCNLRTHGQAYVPARQSSRTLLFCNDKCQIW